jgi:GYF domain 2
VDLYLEQNGELIGPLSPAELREMAQNGRVDSGDFVRKGVDGRAIPAAKVKGLLPAPENKTLILRRSAWQKTTGLAGRIAQGAKERRDKKRDDQLIKKQNDIIIAQQEKQLALAVELERAQRAIARKEQELARAQQETGMVQCPFCQEPVHRAAIKCKHCGEILDASLRRASQPPSPPPQVVINNTNQNAAHRPTTDDSVLSVVGAVALIIGILFVLALCAGAMNHH